MTIDATQFIDIAARGHRPLIGREKRVCFTSCTVDPNTLHTLHGISSGLDVSRGVMLDHLAAFAVKHGFVAAYLSENEAPQLPTTAHQGANSKPKPHSAVAARSVKFKPVSSSSHVRPTSA